MTDIGRRKRPRSGINVLGDLEIDVMAVVWQLKKATVKDVFEELYPKRRLAYTTIMTVMNRLAVKGFLSQNKTQIPYIYEPLVDQREMANSMVRDIIERILGGNPALVREYLQIPGVR